jgi:SAM-dependent methyltransferase
MADYTVSTYGDRIAEIYDRVHDLDPTAAVETLAGLAGDGPVLELGIGTGRIALPLAARGLDVHGLDASEAMVARMREKPGGGAIPVTMGDFADCAVDGTYALVFIVFNTFFGLLTQDDQVRCFANVASHLLDDGVFAIEAFVPDLTRYQQGQRVTVLGAGTDWVRLDAARLDVAAQRLEASQVMLTNGDVQLFPVRLRYAWPSELDLMARLAGLRLRDRWGDWDKRPFGAESTKHISVYGAV